MRPFPQGAHFPSKRSKFGGVRGTCGAHDGSRLCPLQAAPPARVRQSRGRVGLGAVCCAAVGEVVKCAVRPHLCPSFCLLALHTCL